MAEPKTIILNAGSPLTGDSPMNLTRASFQAVGGNTRVQRTSVPSGNVLDNELFGWFSPADVVLVTIHSTSAHPHDVVRHRMSTDAYTEHSLVRPVILVLAPGETLLFATTSAVALTLVANVLSEEQHGSLGVSNRPTRYRARYQTSNPSGFGYGPAYGQVAAWSSTTRRFEASVATGRIAVESFAPGEARFEGVSLRVRLTGYDGTTALVGIATESGEFFGYEVPRGAWSPWLVIRAGESVALETAEKLDTAAAVVADLDVELSPQRGSDSCGGAASTSDGQPGGVPSAGVDWSMFQERSANAASAYLTPQGWILHTHGNVQNANADGNKAFEGSGQGNKAILASSTLDDVPLSKLAGVTIDYKSLSAGVTDVRGVPYVNLQVRLDDTVFILVIDTANLQQDPLNIFQRDPTGPQYSNDFRLSWDRRHIKAVTPDGVDLPGVSPDVANGTNWGSKCYLVDDILAAYPNATIVEAFSGDGGLPAQQLMPGFLIVIGDSTYTKYSRVRIERVELPLLP